MSEWLLHSLCSLVADISPSNFSPGAALLDRRRCKCGVDCVVDMLSLKGVDKERKRKENREELYNLVKACLAAAYAQELYAEIN